MCNHFYQIFFSIFLHNKLAYWYFHGYAKFQYATLTVSVQLWDISWCYYVSQCFCVMVPLCQFLCHCVCLYVTESICQWFFDANVPCCVCMSMCLLMFLCQCVYMSLCLSVDVSVSKCYKYTYSQTLGYLVDVGLWNVGQIILSSGSQITVKILIFRPVK